MLIPRHVPLFDDATLQLIQHAVRAFLKQSRSQGLGLGADDLIQELTLYVLQKAKAYDAEIGAWPTFVNCLVKRKLTLICRSYRSNKNCINLVAQSLQETVVDSQGHLSELAATIEDHASPRQKQQSHRTEMEVWEQQVDVEQVVLKLDGKQRQLCRSLTQKYSRQEVCHSMGISRSSLYRQLRQVKQVFEESGISEAT